MASKCQRCHSPLQPDDFLCPECGHISGDPVSKIQPPNQTKAFGRKNRLPLLCLMLSVCLFFGSLVLYFIDAPESVDTNVVEHYYFVRVVDQHDIPLANITVQFTANDGNITLEGTTDQSGMVLFIAEPSDSATATVMGGPIAPNVSFQSKFPTYYFGDSNFLLIDLLKSNTGYYPADQSRQIKVLVLDQNMQPVPDVGLHLFSDIFTTDYLEEVHTDQDGCAILTYYEQFHQSRCSIMIASLPDGYRKSSNDPVSVYEGTELIYIKVIRESPAIISTIRVVDQYNIPVPGVELYISSYYVSSHQAGILVATNANGIAEFSALSSQPISLRIRSVPDGYSYDTGSYYFSLGEDLTIVIQRQDDNILPIPE